ncbi:ferlin family protein [Besnoitia besnoiti]|uniref:Ferlin family protein n=1 Tax=Besnoitia besnoiti TaxID=94643 RepID=A0A2A9M7D3_BESBE|nr:ferlin family protein [Besnoitia besnoiti]PFH33895.1 ferlin family protein [Besnoitia besnoiti]
MAAKPIQYNVKVDLHEVKELSFRENVGDKEIVPNPYIEVTVNGVTKTTNQKTQVVSATFNTSFNFTTYLTAEEFARSYVEVAVLHKYMLIGGLGLQSADIGKCVFSFAYIYAKSQHWIYRQWVTLRNLEQPQETAGLLLITVGVFGPGDAMPVVDETVVVLNEGGDRTSQDVKVKLTHYNLSVNIYKGQDIPAVPGQFSTVLEPYVKVKHGGAELQTRPLPDSNPEWLASISVPACVPCFDGNVLVELWNGQPSATTGGTLMGTVVLDYFQLTKNDLPPRWFNFYWRPPTEGLLGAVTDMMTSADLRQPIEYGGRILLSASAAKVQTPLPMGVRPARATPEPPTQECVWWIDLYEMTSATGYTSQLRVEIAFGPHTVRTAPLDANAMGTYVIDNETGRMPEQKIFSPVDELQVWDVTMYVCSPPATTVAAGIADVSSWFTGWGGTPAPAAGASSTAPAEWTRLAWVRIPYDTKQFQNGKPQWHTLRSLDGTSTEMFSILMGMEMFPTKAGKTRSERLEYRLARYYFRALIYEGLHLPAVGYDVFPDPYIRVELGSKMLRTTTIRQTLNPSYYEAYEIETRLPENITLAPDINVDVVSESNSILSSDVVLGSVQYPIQKVPKEWKKAPVWLPLQSKAYPRCKAKVLVAFELVPAEKAEDDTYPFFDDIRPSTKEGNIRLFLVGVRLYKPLTQPFVTVCFGRDVEDTSLPLWSQQSSAPRTGEGGNWNFLEEFRVSVSLPKRMQHHSFLEVKVQDKVQGIGGESMTDVGMAYITLNPLLPWLDSREQTECLETFKLQMLEEVLIEDAENARRSTEGGGARNAVDAVDEDGVQKREIAAAERTRKMAIPYNDPDVANLKIEEPDDYVSFQETRPPAGTRPSREPSSRHDGGKAPRDGGTGAPLRGASGVEGGEAPGEAGANEKDDMQIGRQNTSPGEGGAVGGRRDAIVTGSVQGAYGFTAEQLNFMLTVMDEDDTEEMMRDEVPYELEADFTVDDLPYLRTPIFRPTDAGVPETVGYLKYVCRVYQSTDDGQGAEMDQICKSLIETYNSTRDLVVRAYVLAARGLVPPSGASDIQTYVWIYDSENAVTLPGGLSYNIRDTGYVKKQGFKPEFNRCYSLACSLPENSVVQIALMNMGHLSDECIGRTYLDVEDRFFNRKVEQMVLEESTPIELRTLKNEGSTVSHGTLRGFFEIMRSEYAQLHPPYTLASAEPDEYQLRVVIWRVKAVPLDDNSSISLFVRTIYQLEESSEVVKDTDTHYNSRDGTAVYNWRMVFDVLIPAQIPVLKLQIWNYALLSSTEPIGESNLDLTADFFRARKRQQNYRVPKMWVRCSHPAHKGKLRGSIEMEASILPREEAEYTPVGNGREEPNRDPFLPAVTTNRTYVDWQQIGETVGAASNAIMSGLKWTGVWMAVAGVIALVVFVMFLLK